MTSCSISRSSDRLAISLTRLRVLVLKQLQPPHLRGQQPVIILLPVEGGYLADPGFAADVHRGSVHPLPENERLLGVRKSNAFMVIQSAQPDTSRRKFDLEMI